MTKKLNNKKGFTLAELLVVVAIIAVLVAVSIPIFSAQTKKANLATNQANARAAKAAAVTSALSGETATVFTYDIKTGTAATTTTAAAGSGTISTDPAEWTVSNDALSSTVYGTWYVTVNKDGSVTSYNYSK